MQIDLQVKNDIIVRLTSRFQTTEYQKLKEASRWWKELGVDQDRPSVFFVGAFNRNFNFKSVYEAAKTTKNCQFILCGEGPTLNEVKDLMAELPNVFFPGWIDKIKLEALGKMSIACLAPYKNSFDFILSIPNKIVDALSLSLPILSPLKGEVAKLIEENEVGFTYNDDFLLADFINTLIKDMKLQKKMSSNSKKLYELEFEFDMVYDQLVFHLENMVIKKNN